MQQSNDTLYSLTEGQVNEIDSLRDLAARWEAEATRASSEKGEVNDKYQKLKVLLKKTMKS